MGNTITQSKAVETFMSDFADADNQAVNLIKDEMEILNIFCPMRGDLKSIASLVLNEAGDGVERFFGSVEVAEFGDAYAIDSSVFSQKKGKRLKECEAICAYESFVVVSVDEDSISVVCTRTPLIAAYISSILLGLSLAERQHLTAA